MRTDHEKDFIDRHRQEFDSERVSAGLWDRIEADLDAEASSGGSERTVPVRWLWYTVGAAASVIALLMTVLLQTPETQSVAEVESERSGDIPALSLSDISVEMAEVEQYYLSEVNSRKQELMTFEGADEYLEEIEILQEEYEGLKKEMGLGADREKVIEAMIQNYRLRLEILESLLEELRELQHAAPKTEGYEA